MICPSYSSHLPVRRDESSAERLEEVFREGVSARAEVEKSVARRASQAAASASVNGPIFVGASFSEGEAGVRGGCIAPGIPGICGMAGWLRREEETLLLRD